MYTRKWIAVPNVEFRTSTRALLFLNNLSSFSVDKICYALFANIFLRTLRFLYTKAF